MQYMMKIIFIFVGLYLISTVVSSYTNCISEFCFTLSNANLTQMFDGAKAWCQSNASSQLISIGDDETQDAVHLFLNSLSISLSGLIYIDMKLQQASQPTWYLINGSKFIGELVNQNDPAYQLYGHLMIDKGFWRVQTSRPDANRTFICGFSVSVCSTYNDTDDIIRYNGQCYIKYESEMVKWYEARKRCISNGGDLAMFSYPSGTPDGRYDPPFNTSKLNRNLSYWVGIRRNSWSWISPSDNDSETLYYDWSVGKPNNIGYSCVCLDPNGSPQWSWTDCDCNVMRSFLCLKKVATTTSTTTTTTTTTTAIPTSTSVKQNFTSSSMENITSSSTLNSEIFIKGLPYEQKLIIGLVVGVGGALLIIIIIIVLIFRLRKRKESAGGEGNVINSSRLGLDNHKNKRAEVSGDYSSANSFAQDAANADSQYAVVVKSHPQGNTETDESKPEILYTSFSQNLNSTNSHDSDEIDGALVSNSNRSQTFYSPGSNDMYANATGT